MIPTATLHAIDWAVVGAYGLVVLTVGWLANRKQTTSASYLLGGRRIPWILLAASLLATSFSSISLLSLTGKGYFSGMQWMQLWVGELLAALVVALVFLPAYAKRPGGTAYELLERRFGRTSRLLASAAFHVLVLVRAGILLFLTAQALSVLTGMDDRWGILLAGAVAMAYSATGGLRAVVWTDTIQLVLIVVGVGGAFVLILSGMPDGLGGLARAQATHPDWLQFDLSPKSWPTLLTGAIPYGVILASIAGTNQQLVQRYMACSDLRAARRALWSAWAIGTAVAVLTMGLGVALLARYGAGLAPENDQILPTFILEHVPVGLAGVLVAAIFAAAMSSTDSAVHSMATATLVDFIEPRRPMTDAVRLRVARVLTVGYGILGVSAAFVAREGGKDVFDTLVKWMSLLAGPILALFLLALLSRRLSERAALTGVVVGYLTSLGLGTTWLDGTRLGVQALGLHPIWIAAIATAVSVLVALVCGRVVRALQPSMNSKPTTTAHDALRDAPDHDIGQTT